MSLEDVPEIDIVPDVVRLVPELRAMPLALLLEPVKASVVPELVSVLVPPLNQMP